MTLVDTLALVLGAALAFAVRSSKPGFPFVPTPQVMLALAVVDLFEWANLTIAVVVLARVASHQRMPFAVEWVALLVAVTDLAGLPAFRVDPAVNRIFEAVPRAAGWLDFDGWRWVVAGLVSLVIVVALAVLWRDRRVTPPWLSTLVLTSLGLLMVAGPLSVFALLGDDLVSPREGFGPGDLAILHRGACNLFGYGPMGLFFGVPVVAALGDRFRGARWSWVEWSASATASLVGVSLLTFYRGEFTRVSVSWAFERLIVFAWFAAVVLISRLIVNRWGLARGSRWFSPETSPWRPGSPEPRDPSRPVPR